MLFLYIAQQGRKEESNWTLDLNSQEVILLKLSKNGEWLT